MPGADAYKVWTGIYFDESSWDGSDIFMPPGSGFVFVVDRVKQAFERAQLTNFAFHRLSEIERIMLT